MVRQRCRMSNQANATRRECPDWRPGAAQPEVPMGRAAAGRGSPGLSRGAHHDQQPHQVRRQAGGPKQGCSRRSWRTWPPIGMAASGSWRWFPPRGLAHGSDRDRPAHALPLA